ncbi:ABC transporter ATP-binding protein [Nonomuraea sp. B10E15]|uniref:ABC transporter ATP-binding protein n=1 Tax=Nonomuraea sp. B10E15 TaxID=3153560 RepID=UPI00325C428C
MILVQSVLTVVPAFLGQQIIDEGIARRDLDAVWLFGGALAVSGVALAAALVIERRFATRLGEDMILDLRTDMYAHLLRQAPGFFKAARTGAIVSRLDGDVAGVQRIVTVSMPLVANATVMIVVSFCAILLLEWRMALGVVVLAPAAYALSAWMGHVLETVSRRQLEAKADLNSLVTERCTPGGIDLVHLYGDTRHEIGLFLDQAHRNRSLAVRKATLSAALSSSLNILMTTATAAVNIAAGYWVIKEDMSLGTMVTLLTLLARLYGHLTILPSVKADLVTGWVSFSRVQEVLDFPPLVREKSDAVPLPGRHARGMSVTISGLSFDYPSADTTVLRSLAGDLTGEERRTLRNLDISIPSGTTVGIVGSTGSGKSTLARLISRAWDPTTGSIAINGVDLRNLRLGDLRAAVGVVSQESHLFNDTIRANLLMARPDATDDQLAQACRTAQIWPLIESLPHALDTVVGAGGARLSGGERQRLSLARLLLTDPGVVILDEATSHLDTVTEMRVHDALKPFLRGRTCFVIAHRLATVRDADLILVMHEGRILEAGRHETLMRYDGAYRRMATTLPARHSRPASAETGDQAL